MLTQAELLTEILGHHTWARAVARMVWVITWLVVVHLIGRVIWSKRRVLRLTQKVLSAVEVIFRTLFCGEYTFFKLDFGPQPAMKKEKQMLSLNCSDLKYADKREIITK